MILFLETGIYTFSFAMWWKNANRNANMTYEVQQRGRKLGGKPGDIIK